MNMGSRVLTDDDDNRYNDDEYQGIFLLYSTNNAYSVTILLAYPLRLLPCDLPSVTWL